MPLGESHAVLDDVELEKLPKLGESVSLNDHMQRNFFNVVGTPNRELYEFTVPVLVRQNYLERLDGWRDWRTLSVYMMQQFLQPVLVFRNTPMPTKRITDLGLVETVNYFVADVRVMCGRDEPFVWSGA